MEITYASSSSRNIGDIVSSSAGGSGSMAPTRTVKVIPLQYPSTSSYPSKSASSMAAVWRWGTKVKSMTLNEWIELCLPCHRWIRTYKWREYLQSDLMAGLTVGVMLVPQAMSYAKLAGLEPIYGLLNLYDAPAKFQTSDSAEVFQN